MPFIRGRFRLNPITGEALEAAREAEAALFALEREGGKDESGPSAREAKTAAMEKGRIHHIVIEAANVVPSHTGRSVRGFVACIHRHSNTDAGAPDDESDWRDAGDGTYAQVGSVPAESETHAFSDHRDLLSFLRSEFERNGQNN